MNQTVKTWFMPIPTCHKLWFSNQEPAKICEPKFPAHLSLEVLAVDWYRKTHNRNYICCPNQVFWFIRNSENSYSCSSQELNFACGEKNSFPPLKLQCHYFFNRSNKGNKGKRKIKIYQKGTNLMVRLNPEEWGDKMDWLVTGCSWKFMGNFRMMLEICGVSHFWVLV